MTGGQGCIYSVYCVYLLSFLYSRNQSIFLESQKMMNPSGTSLKLKILKSTSFLKIFWKKNRKYASIRAKCLRGGDRLVLVTPSLVEPRRGRQNLHKKKPGHRGRVAAETLKRSCTVDGMMERFLIVYGAQPPLKKNKKQIVTF